MTKHFQIHVHVGSRQYLGKGVVHYAVDILN